MNKDSEALLNAIQILINANNKKLKFNYYIEGTILSLNQDGTCNVDHNGETLKSIKTREGLSLSINDIVLICVINGNFSNKFIDLKRP